MSNIRNWIDEEIDYLKENYGTVDIKYIAKKLNRSVDAVISKRERSGVPNAIQNSGYVSLRQVLFNILGYMDNTRIYYKLKDSNCPFHKVKTKERVFTCINIDEFWKWLEHHQDLINFKNFKENSLGAEPEWIKIKRKNDIENNTRKMWTDEDISMLKLLLSQHKFTYDDICKRLGRTKPSVERKIQKLGIPDRPVYYH